LPLERWLEKCFANILPIIALQRIWDKVMGGSSIIMVFLLISIFTRFRLTILKTESSLALVEFVKSTSPDVAELIVTEAIEMWQSNGSPLTAGSNTDCFKDQSQKQASLASKNHRNSNANQNQIHPRSMTISWIQSTGWRSCERNWYLVRIPQLSAKLTQSENFVFKCAIY